jgi:hypothetical protein
MKDAEDRYVESRLDEWGVWLRSGKPRLGYPPYSPEGKLMKNGGVLIKGTGEWREQENFNAQEVEDLVLAYSHIWSRAAKALRLRYVADENCTIDQLAYKYGCGIRMYKYYLADAKRFLKEQLLKKKQGLIPLANAA